jgi:hypothetical protein
MMIAKLWSFGLWTLGVLVFGLWRVCFPPCLVRPGRRLPVQGLSEGSLGYRGRLPAWRGPGTGAVPGLPEIKEKSGIWNRVPVGFWSFVFG